MILKKILWNVYNVNFFLLKCELVELDRYGFFFIYVMINYSKFFY